VFSPSRDPDLIKTPSVKITVQRLKDENNQNALNSEKTSQQPDDSGFLSRVGTLKLDSPDTKPTNEEKLPYRPLSKSRTQLFGSETSQSKSVNVPPPVNPVLQTKKEEVQKEFPFPRKPFLDAHQRPPMSGYKCAVTHPEEPRETPLKGNQDFQFVTPSTRPFSAVKGSSQAFSSTADRDPNKKPKVLFTTPVASSLKNQVTPIGTIQRKLSPLKEVSAAVSQEVSKVEENILIINNVEYVIYKKIGSGGSSLVYLAKSRKLGKEVAIKVVNLDGDSQMVEGYLNETKLLVRLQRNINVVELYDHCHLSEKKILYMIMEKGESDLHRVLQSYTTNLPLYVLMKFWYEMLQAVNYIHKEGVIHSDLKPANFLVVNGRLKLIDFGIASNIAIDSTSIIKFSQAGTFNYISPEALIDTSTGDSPARGYQPRIRISTRSDVWSLGCILYLLLYRKTPFSHIKTLPQKISAITSPRTVIDYPELPNYYPPLLLEMLKKCLIYDPKKRPTVAELLTYPFDYIIEIQS
jgi:hypothetical protein